MGFVKGENAGVIFLSVANGKLIRQHKEPTKDTVSRTNKTGKTVHEETINAYIGTIVDISTKENDYGVQWLIKIKDEEETVCIQMPYSSRYTASFLKALPNITMGKEIKFMPWQMEDKKTPGKTISGVTVYQNDGDGWVKVPPFYTKEEPNGLPEMEKKKVKENGKTVDRWNDTAMMEFLEEMAKEWAQSNKNFLANQAPKKQPIDEDPPF